MKRINVLLIIFMLITCSFIGCGKSDAESGVESDSEEQEAEIPSGDVSLKVWGPEEDAEILEQCVAGFKAEYGQSANFDITIEYCSEADCKAKMIEDITTAADVFTFADDQLSILAGAGILRPIEYNVDDVKSRNVEGSVSAATILGNLYAYPLTADNGYFLYYNKDYFSEEDLATLDGVLAVCASNGKKMTFDIGNAWYFYAFYGQTGLEIGLNDDGISNYCTWNSTENAYTGVEIMDGISAVCSNPGFLNGGDGVLNEGAANGTVIAGVSGVWDSTTLKEIWGDKLGACKLPTYTVSGQQVQMSSFAGYKLIGVNSYSENRYWAEVLADYMTNESSQTLRFQIREQGPSNISAGSSAEVAEAVGIKAVIAQSDYAKLQRVGGAYWSAVSQYGADLANHTTNGLTQQEYLDNLVAKITASNN